MSSMRPVLNEDERRLMPCTTYPLSRRSRASSEPSCPVTPVISATFSLNRCAPACVHAGFAGMPRFRSDVIDDTTGRCWQAPPPDRSSASNRGSRVC